MKKYIFIIAKVIFTLILIMPVLGVIGIFPAPTRDLYNTDLAYNFINMLMQVKYVTYINAVVSILTIFLLWTKREAAAAILVLPLTVHVVAFHLFIDGGIFTSGAILGNLLLIINLYLVYKFRNIYKQLINRN